MAEQQRVELLDFMIYCEKEDKVMGKALTQRARDKYGSKYSRVLDHAAIFIDNFPTDWRLGIVDKDGTLYVLTNNVLH